MGKKRGKPSNKAADSSPLPPSAPAGTGSAEKNQGVIFVFSGLVA